MSCWYGIILLSSSQVVAHCAACGHSIDWHGHGLVASAQVDYARSARAALKAVDSCFAANEAS